MIEASQQTLAQAKETIRQALLSQRRQAALAEFSEEYSEKWRERTECGEGYMISQCGNGPDPTATPRAARTAPPASRG